MLLFGPLLQIGKIELIGVVTRQNVRIVIPDDGGELGQKIVFIPAGSGVRTNAVDILSHQYQVFLALVLRLEGHADQNNRRDFGLGHGSVIWQALDVEAHKAQRSIGLMLHRMQCLHVYDWSGMCCMCCM